MYVFYIRLIEVWNVRDNEYDFMFSDSTERREWICYYWNVLDWFEWLEIELIRLRVVCN